MLEPTDRVVAKTLVRTLGFTLSLILPDANPEDVATVIKYAQKLVVGDNPALSKAIKDIVGEVKDEMQAEQAELATSMTDQPKGVGAQPNADFYGLQNNPWE